MGFWILIGIGLLCQIVLGLTVSLLSLEQMRVREEEHLGDVLGIFRRSLERLVSDRGAPDLLTFPTEDGLPIGDNAGIPLLNDAGFNRGLARFVMEFARGSSYRFTIVDQSGKVLADSEADPAIMDNHLKRPEIDAAFTRGSGVSVRHSSSVNYRTLYFAEKYGDVVIRIAVPLSLIDRVTATLSGTSIAIMTLSLMISIGSGISIYRVLMLPLRSILHSAGAYQRGDLSFGPIIHRPYEFALIARAMRDMATLLNNKIHQTSQQKWELERLFESIREPVILIDRHQTIHSFNRPALHIIKRLAAPDDPLEETILGTHLLAYIRSSELADLLDGIFTHTSSRNGLVTVYGKDISTFEVYAVPMPQASEDKTLVMVVLYPMQKSETAEPVVG